MTTDATSQAIPPPPRATGDPPTDALAGNQYLWDLYTALTATLPSIDPQNLPPPDTATLASAQLVANLAYQLGLSINDALSAAHVAGFPVTPPTS